MSELLQSQLWQPINITPLQPQLAEANLLILEGTGPSDPSFNEFSPLFNRNRLALQADGIVAGNDTLGDDLVQSGVWDRISYSLGQFHYETDGFRDNNDLKENIYNIFAQAVLSYRTSIQAEFRYFESEYGDLNLWFDREAILPDLRNDYRTRLVRTGLRHSFTPNSALIASALYSTGEGEFRTPQTLGFGIESEGESYMGEVQHLLRWNRIRLVSGAGYADTDYKSTTADFWSDTESKEKEYTNHTNIYANLHLDWPRNVSWMLGGSYDHFETDAWDDDQQFNPKFGVIWNPFRSTLLRAAVFRVFTRTLLTGQTIEPTQVAGFNQFFDDAAGTRSWRYGAALDQKVARSLFGGVEFSKRELEVPFMYMPPPPEDPSQPPQPAPSFTLRHTDWDEYLGRAYVYWTPHPWIAAGAEFRYEKFEYEPEFTPGNVLELRTYWLTPAVDFFHPWGLKARVQASFVDQSGEFGDQFSGFQPEDDQFWVLDASIGYRLPNRWGIITLTGKNLLDEEFRFQDTDPANPRIAPERYLLARVTLSF